MPKPPTLSYSSYSPDADSPEQQSYRETLLGRIDRRFLATPAARITLGALLAAALIIPSVQFIVRIRRVEPSLWRAGGERHRTALGRWIPTAELLTNPQTRDDPYGFGHWFPTPPMVLISLVPLSKLGYLGAGVAWAAMKVGGFILAMGLLIKSLGRKDFAIPLGVIIAAGLYSIRPIVSDLQHGNLNIFMLIWLALAWALYVQHRDVWAGLFLALAIVTKLTPALVLVYFLYKRAWRVCIGAGVGLVLVFLLIPGLALGMARNVQYLHAWFDMLVAPFALHGYATLEVDNQSLYSVVLRLGSHVGLLNLQDMPTEQAFNAGVDNMARPASMLGRLLRPALSVPIVFALGWLCRSRSRSRRDQRLLLEFSLVLIAMLLLSERTWDHHATTLPIVFLANWYVLTCKPFSDRFRAWFVAGLVAQLVLLVGSTAGFLPERITNTLFDNGVFCWGLLLCLVQTGVLLRALNRWKLLHSGQPGPAIANSC